MTIPLTRVTGIRSGPSSSEHPKGPRASQASAIERSHETSAAFVDHRCEYLRKPSLSSSSSGVGDRRSVVAMAGQRARGGFSRIRQQGDGKFGSVRNQVAIGRGVFVEEILEGGDLGEQVFLPVLDLPLAG